MLFGIRTTPTGQSAFLISLAALFVPLICVIVDKEVLSKRMIAGLVIALTGVGLLHLEHGLKLTEGSILCILSAFCFAIWVFLQSKIASKVSSLEGAFVQMICVSALSFVIAFLIIIFPYHFLILPGALSFTWR